MSVVQLPRLQGTGIQIPSMQLVLNKAGKRVKKKHAKKKGKVRFLFLFFHTSQKTDLISKSICAAHEFFLES
jgi:hypothetical protein